MLIYLLRLPTEYGPRYAADYSSGRTETLHPSLARRFDLNEPLPEQVVSQLDEVASFELVIVAEAECLHPECDYTWESKGSNVRKGGRSYGKE